MAQSSDPVEQARVRFLGVSVNLLTHASAFATQTLTTDDRAARTALLTQQRDTLTPILTGYSLALDMLYLASTNRDESPFPSVDFVTWRTAYFNLREHVFALMQLVATTLTLDQWLRLMQLIVRDARLV